METYKIPHCTPNVLIRNGFTQTRDGWVLYFVGYKPDIKVRFLIQEDDFGKFLPIKIDAYKNNDLYAAFYNQENCPNNEVVKIINRKVVDKMKEIGAKERHDKDKLHSRRRKFR